MNIVLCLLITTSVYFAAECQDYDDPDGRRVRFHTSRQREGQECHFNSRPGVCRRRSRCRFPTNKVCRGGLIPIICCLEEPLQTEPPKPIRTTPKPIRTTPKPIRTTPKPIPTTPKPIRTTPKPIRTTSPKIEEINDVNIVFPGCGTRTPSGPDRTPKTEPPKRDVRGRRRGIFRERRGKRSLRDRRRRGIKPVIVGGEIVKPNSWPWMVAIFKKVGTSPRFLCGASLISKNYILTAAHCFNTNEVKEPAKFSAVVGAHNTNDGTSYNVESIKVHPSYKPGQYYYDMCLIKVREEVALGNKVYPVCLPSGSLRSRIGSANKNVTVTGWGDTSFGGPSSKLLQEVELPIVPLKQCNESYHKTASRTFPEGITQLFICAGLKGGGKDSCQGDSGGPLTMEMEGGNYVQLGVVSFGMGCAQPGFPGVYTRVSKLTKWIKDNTDLGRN